MTKHSHAHDSSYSLAHALLIAFLSVLGGGLILHTLFLLPKSVPLRSWIPEEDPTTWKLIRQTGDTSLYQRKIFDSPLFSYRSVSLVDIPRETLLNVFQQDTKWVKNLIKSEQFPISESENEALRVETHTLRQLYSFPGVWGISDRDYVMKTTTTIHKKGDTVTIHFENVDDARFPVKDDIVRAKNLGSKWVFRELDGGRTEVEAEIAVDPLAQKILCPFFVNHYMKTWLLLSLRHLYHEALIEMGHETEDLIPRVFDTLFPLKH